MEDTVQTDVQPTQEVTPDQTPDPAADYIPASLLIKSIDKLFVQDQNETVFDVTFSFYRNGEHVEDKRFSYPLTTSIEELKAETVKQLSAYNNDCIQAIRNAAQDEVHKEADATIEQLTGATVAADGTFQEAEPGQAPAEANPATEQPSE